MANDLWPSRSLTPSSDSFLLPWRRFVHEGFLFAKASTNSAKGCLGISWYILSAK